MELLLFAQSLIDSQGVGSSFSLTGSLRELRLNLASGLRTVDQRTWMTIAIGLLVVLFLTRRSRRS